MKDKLTCGHALAVPVPNQKERVFRAVSATACWAIENRDCKELLVLSMTRKHYLQRLKPVQVKTKKNLFGSSCILSRTIDHWRQLLDNAFKLIESLRAELFKSRAETQKALGEKEKAESECIHSKLKLYQMQAQIRVPTSEDLKST